MKVLVFRAKPVLVAAVCVMLCALVGALGEATRAMQVQAAEEKRPIYSVEIEEKKVALGINCAWGDEDIPELIRALEEADVKATFFLVGEWCDRCPDSVRALADAGHELGGHSDSHPDMAKLDRDGIVRELELPAAKIEKLTGKRPTLFRPPSGSYNSTVIETAEQLGFYPIQWDCDSIDYKNPTAEQMRERILKKLQPGSIMLFHSGAKNTPGALPGIIQAVREQGYEFVPVSELVLPPPYYVDFAGRQHPALDD